jgi:uncharacterized phage protein gp47/JayE
MLGYMFNLLFADTAEGIWLDRVVGDFGVTREPATCALRRISLFGRDKNPMDVDIGTRFAVHEVSFRLNSRTSIGIYEATCEQLGVAGNQYGGDILPVDNVNGLGSATLDAAPLIPAQDAETDDALRERFYLIVRENPYGGNVSDYTIKTLSVAGVGAVKVFPAKVMGKGNVGLVVGDENSNRATQTLVDKVQVLMGEDGNGIAPIGHTVHVTTCTDLNVNVTAGIRLKNGYTFSQVEPVVNEAIRSYIDNIGFNDDTIYHAKLVSEMLTSHEGIIDAINVTMNGSGENIKLIKEYANYQVPLPGNIVLNEVTS